MLAALAGSPLLLGALGGVAAAAVAIALAGRDPRLGADVGVAIAVGALFGAGTLLALVARRAAAPGGAAVRRPAGDDRRRSRHGRGAGRRGAGALAPCTAGSRWRRSTAARRRALGAPPARAELALLGVLAAVTVAAAPVLGNLLVVALVLAPGAAALLLARRLVVALVLAAALAALAAVGGIVLAYDLDVAAGAAVALCAVASLGVAAAVSR